MKHFFPSPALCFFVLVLMAAPSMARAQSKATPAPDLGWGSAWLEPTSGQQRQEQALLGKIKAAGGAHDTRLALALTDQLIAMEPNSASPYVVRAGVHGQLKRYDLALADLDRGLEVARKETRDDWSVSLLTFRAFAHTSMKDYGAAVTDLEAALKIDGQDRAALNSLAWLRATAPEAALRNGPESVRLAKKALAGSAGSNRYATIDTLAAAYAEAGDYARAVDSEKRAMTAAGTEIRDAATAQKFQDEAARRLRLFELHQTYHADPP